MRNNDSIISVYAAGRAGSQYLRGSHVGLPGTECSLTDTLVYTAVTHQLSNTLFLVYYLSLLALCSPLDALFGMLEVACLVPLFAYDDV
jgi:hypothetical protein